MRQTVAYVLLKRFHQIAVYATRTHTFEYWKKKNEKNHSFLFYYNVPFLHSPIIISPLFSVYWWEVEAVQRLCLVMSLRILTFNYTPACVPCHWTGRNQNAQNETNERPKKKTTRKLNNLFLFWFFDETINEISTKMLWTVQWCDENWNDTKYDSGHQIWKHLETVYFPL